ncbi:MAG TPA: protoporphyrinogen oxidase HemJ [Methylococcaceae bacterium]|nr:protoporphyrinogen oxidase HemJ [Methylococcaceae bacterium]
MLWFKALHLIAMVCWFAGLFYLPRLYVYHAMSDDAVSGERFKIMERKLFYGIMTPAMLATFAGGIGLLVTGSWQLYATANWLHAKFLLLACLVVYHYFCWRWLKDFRDEANFRSHVFYRWMNEVPVIFLIAIVILAVVKPIF